MSRATSLSSLALVLACLLACGGDVADHHASAGDGAAGGSAGGDSGGASSGAGATVGGCVPTGLPAAGEIPIARASGLAALCDGRVLVGNTAMSTLDLYDVTLGSLVSSWSIGDVPLDVIYDKEQNTAYVTFWSSTSIAKIELGTNTVESITVGSIARGVALGGNGRVFVSMEEPEQTVVAVVNGPAGVVEQTIPLGPDESGTLLVYDSPGSQLIVGRANASVSSLNRYAVDPLTADLTRIQHLEVERGACNYLAISPDGNRIAQSCGVPEPIPDVSTEDLDVTFGAWDPAGYPASVVFGSDGELFIASGALAKVGVYDSRHQRVGELIPRTAPSLGLSFLSREGGLLYALQAGAAAVEQSALYWFVP